MSLLQQRSAALVRRADRQVRGLWRSGALPTEAFVGAAATLIALHRATGATLADLTVAANLTASRRAPVAPLGITLGDERERLEGSVGTVLEAEILGALTPEDLAFSRELRLGRLARDATAEAVVAGVGMAMIGHGVRGWVRETGPTPCEFCTRWADGIVRSAEVQMIRHTDCNCVQRMVA